MSHPYGTFSLHFWFWFTSLSGMNVYKVNSHTFTSVCVCVCVYRWFTSECHKKIQAFNLTLGLVLLHTSGGAKLVRVAVRLCALWLLVEVSQYGERHRQQHRAHYQEMLLCFLTWSHEDQCHVSIADLS